jgi:hypothetical protein
LTDPAAPADVQLAAGPPRRDPALRGAVIHLNNEQPVVADLFEYPTARDVAVLCTNVRTQDGKRPIFIDHSDSIFVIPLAYVRFIELPQGGPGGDGSDGASGRSRSASAAPVEEEIEIDEDFLRKIRDA